MNSELFIPETIKVGYQKRDDTYTKKLAYVIYIDQTGKVRKEASWNTWRDNSIEPNDFKNEPTEGFVLNKHVGGHKSGWEFRKSYCRIYDPRGFEFEITIENLLWILEYEDCYHGKGLSGKYVYCWDGTDLVLMPCSTPEYEKSSTHSKSLFGTVKLSKSGLVPGSSYRHKNKESYIFIGELELKGSSDRPIKKLFFKPVNNRESYRVNVKDPYDTLVCLDVASLLYKECDDCITEEQINDYIYRFNLTAWSYSFWKNKDVIDHFENFDVNPIMYERYSSHYTDVCGLSVLDNYILEMEYCGKVSADGKSVEVVVPYLQYRETKSTYYGYRLISEMNQAKFGTIHSDLSMDVKLDLGKCNSITYNINYNRDSVDYYNTQTYDNIKNGKYNLADVEVVRDLIEKVNKKYEKPLTAEMFKNIEYKPFVYVTKDGYISESLCYLAITDSLTEVCSKSKKIYSTVCLPAKKMPEVTLRR